jgi:hypothetical protein
MSDTTNKLTFVRRVTSPGQSPHRALYACQCGNTIEAYEGGVKNNHTRSCGCIRKEPRPARKGTGLSHGHFVKGTPSRTYVSWQAMIRRCTNPNSDGFEVYGGNGITVCDEWLNSFETFLLDMGERPSGTTLDRIDGSLGYHKGNCRWQTPKEQARNRANNKRFSYRGVMLTVAEIMEASKTEVGKDAIKYRLKCGITADDAVVDASPGMAKLLESDVSAIIVLLDAGASGRELAERYGVSPATISRIKQRKVWRHLCGREPRLRSEERA